MLTGATEEVGTNDPTKVSSTARARYDALVKRDPAFSWQLFLGRVGLVFRTFNDAWSQRDLRTMRPYLSDGLFETERYWIATYIAQGLTNKVDGAHLVSIDLSRVVEDAFFDAITVRVFAEGHDFTVDASGRVVGGSRTELRRYSEYWTFLRSRARTGAPRVDPGCPNCGASIDAINMAGTCASCSSKITRGDFDWVLSRIEQDEVFELDG